ncbi:hypothetical protein OIV83_003200 [Microbotryomycetes sp. JL201]|nr:hypothetical protein OIV83_003200 [Microbotryomycetes sp. JL201]
MSLSKPPSHATDKPSILNDEVGKANRRAQIDGVVAGVAAGFISGQMTLRMFKQSRNASLLSGLLAGVGVGYVMTQQSLKIHLEKARVAHAQLRQHMDQLSHQQAGTNDARFNLDTRETASDGSLLEDPYATTRGDH